MIHLIKVVLHGFLKIFVVFNFLSGLGFSIDTLIINPITFDSPSPGPGWNVQYKAKVSFPSEIQTWSKILMLQTLKCDSSTKADEYDCGAWDYIWDATLIVEKDDRFEKFKLGSFVTPYGKRLKLGENNSWTWSYNITDYAPILNGDLDIIIGNNQELLDLKFLFIEGNPPRDVLDVKNIFPPGTKLDHSLNDKYQSVYRYSALASDSVLQATEVILREDAYGFKIKSIISGHGHAGPNYCCEWTKKWHSILINGKEQFRWNVWKDCGYNPIFPQGGTWPYDRAGWCPGTKVDEYSFEISDIVSPGDTILVDYEIEPMTDDKEGSGTYIMAYQIFSYGPPNFASNVEILEVLRPSSEDRYSRINPSLYEPKIVVKNSGSDVVKNMRISYGLTGGKESVYRWNGSLLFLDEIEISLPVPDWRGLLENNEFTINIDAINGRKDHFNNDNKMKTRVPIPKELPSIFTIVLKTNDLGRSIENKLKIIDHFKSTLISKQNFMDDVIYRIPIRLNPGYYEFLFTDSLQNGIDRLWWKSNKDSIGTRGQLRFLGEYDSILVDFTPDFGEKIRFPFYIETFNKN